MNLKPKAAAAWLAAPLVAMTLIACGDDGTSASTEPDAGTMTATATPECGDSTQDEGEECDDGNTEDGDGCSKSCKEEPSPTCGDGKVDEGEQCDLGPKNDAAGEDCTKACLNDVHGDGHRSSTEDCDDGNRIDDDGCTNDGKKPEVGPECGDGNKDADEDCDLGAKNGLTGNDCTVACQTNACGDGLRGSKEECDDGNTIGGDTCSADCKAPEAPVDCGDGKTDEGEACDDGDDNGTRDSACTESCKAAKCGDAIISAEEACDEGAENGLDGSNCGIDCKFDTCGNGQVGPLEECDDETDGCNSDCESTTCGDGTKQASEECDNGADNGADGNDCTNKCKSNVCGDTHVGGAEECDLGKGNGGNGSPGVNCTDTCMDNTCGDGFVAGGELCDEGDANSDAADATCTSACTTVGCGDGILQDGEECDNGGDNDDESACTTKCADAMCGDGHLQAGELCDDGNANSDLVEGACRMDCTPAGCGDNVIDSDKGEECDLGAQNGIGGVCSSNCKNTSCGDGVVQDDEACDDGNTNNNDSCLTNCAWNVCGDGAVYTAKSDPLNTADVEECDDANDSDGDSCLGTCVYNVCADNETLTMITEPYGDPDQNGPMTASRAGVASSGPVALGLLDCVDEDDDCYNDPYHHSGSGTRTGNGLGQIDADDGGDCEVGVVILGLPIAGESDHCVPEPLEDFILGDVDVEACDDGNAVNTDACVAANFDDDGALECQVAECGDGLVQAGVEQCDEAIGSAARGTNNDSCLDTCKYNACQDGWLYLTKSDTSNAATLEACDDGNAVGTDLCSATCTVAGVTSNTGISATCGDSVIQPGEGCDKGAANSNGAGSACSTACQIPTCGNGIREGEEQCDDNNGDNNDQCLNTCLWNACGDGFRYIITTSGPSNNQALEECDDANSNNRDECTTSCLWNECGDTGVFTYQSGLTTNALAADDGSLTGLSGPSWASDGASLAVDHNCEDPGTTVLGEPYDDCTATAGFEGCDDGNAVNGDGCNSCVVSNCGDSVVDLEEECDDGNVVDGDGCEADCQFPPSCGDGIMQDGEGCDGDDLPGGVGPDVTCLADCRLSTCHGTAGQQSGEECDDANTVDSDHCTNRCLEAKCGDGILQPTGLDDGGATPLDDEECDDGNDVETDSCTNECKFNVLGDGIRYLTKNIDSYDGALHECDTGEVTDTMPHANRMGTARNDDACPASGAMGSCDGDGFLDETDFCGAWDDSTVAIRGKILCAPVATSRGITKWKTDTYCLMPAEGHGDHGDTAAPDLLSSNWYEAKAHCESYGLDARLVVVNTEALRTTLAQTSAAAGVAGIDGGAQGQSGICQDDNDGAICATDGACTSGTCAVATTCQGGIDDGDVCESDTDCDATIAADGLGDCDRECAVVATPDGGSCTNDAQCDGDCGVSYSWIGLYDDFTGAVQGGTPVSSNPGRWYWLDNALDNPNTTSTRQLWKYTFGPPAAFPVPSDGGDCGALDQGTNATVTVATEGWQDVSCAANHAFMCEFPL